MGASTEPGAMKMNSLVKEEQPAKEPGEAVKEAERGEKVELQRLQAEEEDFKKGLADRLFGPKRQAEQGGG